MVSGDSCVMHLHSETDWPFLKGYITELTGLLKCEQQMFFGMLPYRYVS